MYYDFLTSELMLFLERFREKIIIIMIYEYNLIMRNFLIMTSHLIIRNKKVPYYDS